MHTFIQLRNGFAIFIALNLLITINAFAQGQQVKSLNKNLIGKWTAGSQEKGVFNLVIGESGNGTLSVLADKKMGDNEYCHCKYSSKINFTWKVKKDSLILFFAKTSVDNGQSIPAANVEPHAQKLCTDMACDIIKITTYGMTNELKANYLRGPYILAGNTLDFAGSEYKRE